MSDTFDPNDPYGLGGAADPFGLGFGGTGYTTQPYQQNALLDYLLSLSKGDLSRTRSALTGVGTDLTNQGKVLGIQNKMYDNQGDLLKLAMNPAIGQMSGAFDPMTMMGAGQPGGGGAAGGLMPFGATDFSPIRSQWETSQTPASQAVLAMFDQIDQGQDPTTLVSQFTKNTGGSLDIPDESTGLTGKQLLQYGQAYWNEATQRQAAQAQYQYKQANTPPPGMEGVDPTLGSFTEPYVQPAIGDTLVGNEVQRQDQNAAEAAARRKAMFDSLAGVTASGQSALGNLNPTAAMSAPQNVQDQPDSSMWGLPDAIGNFFRQGMRGGGKDTTEKKGKPGNGGGGTGSWGGGTPSPGSKPIGTQRRAPAPSGPTPEQRQQSNTYVAGRLSSLEDKERARLGLAPRSSGQSVGQRNLEARLRYLGGSPYPG